MMPDDNTVYHKVGRRYEPLGVQFAGFPADGIWYVHDGTKSLIMRIGDLPDPMPLAALERHRATAEVALMEAQKPVTDRAGQLWYQSAHDQISAVFLAIAKAEQAAK